MPGKDAAALAPPRYGIAFVDRASAPGAALAPLHSVLLGLQRSAGNRAVSRLVTHRPCSISAAGRFSAVEVDRDPPVPGAIAWTRGGKVETVLPSLRATHPVEGAILRHEQEHVRQQAAGALPVTRWESGEPINDDPRLERAANEAAVGANESSRRQDDCVPPGSQSQPLQLVDIWDLFDMGFGSWVVSSISEYGYDKVVRALRGIKTEASILYRGGTQMLDDALKQLSPEPERQPFVPRSAAVREAMERRARQRQLVGAPREGPEPEAEHEDVAHQSAEMSPPEPVGLAPLLAVPQRRSGILRRRPKIDIKSLVSRELAAAEEAERQRKEGEHLRKIEEFEAYIFGAAEPELEEVSRRLGKEATPENLAKKEALTRELVHAAATADPDYLDALNARILEIAGKIRKLAPTMAEEAKAMVPFAFEETKVDLKVRDEASQQLRAVADELLRKLSMIGPNKEKILTIFKIRQAMRREVSVTAIKSATIERYLALIEDKIALARRGRLDTTRLDTVREAIERELTFRDAWMIVNNRGLDALTTLLERAMLDVEQGQIALANVGGTVAQAKTILGGWFGYVTREELDSFENEIRTGLAQAQEQVDLLRRMIAVWDDPGYAERRKLAVHVVSLGAGRGGEHPADA
jgi:hypothetical protein